MKNVMSAKSIEMVPIDQIHILNPRVRNRQIFSDITANVLAVGLKRPITVTPRADTSAGKHYDLVCGQGRLEIYMQHKQKNIPAIVIQASETDALIMSLVENIARRRYSATDLFRAVESLKQKGYDN